MMFEKLCSVLLFSVLFYCTVLLGIAAFSCLFNYKKIPHKFH